MTEFARVFGTAPEGPGVTADAGIETSSPLSALADERLRVRAELFAACLCTPLGRTTLTSSSSSEEIAAPTLPAKSNAQTVSVIKRLCRFIECESILLKAGKSGRLD
jgi:hypothetical protein